MWVLSTRGYLTVLLSCVADRRRYFTAIESACHSCRVVALVHAPLFLIWPTQTLRGRPRRLLSAGRRRVLDKPRPSKNAWFAVAVWAACVWHTQIVNVCALERADGNIHRTFCGSCGVFHFKLTLGEFKYTGFESNFSWLGCGRIRAFVCVFHRKVNSRLTIKPILKHRCQLNFVVFRQNFYRRWVPCLRQNWLPSLQCADIIAIYW